MEIQDARKKRGANFTHQEKMYLLSFHLTSVEAGTDRPRCLIEAVNKSFSETSCTVQEMFGIVQLWADLTQDLL